MEEKIIEKEYEGLVKYYEAAGGNSHALVSKDFASMVINGDKVLGINSTEGIMILATRREGGVLHAQILIKKGYRLKNPVHLCFGMLPKEGKQEIKMDITAEDNSEASFVAHCIFPNAVKVEHIMDALIHIGKGAKISYKETHFHGKTGGVKVVSKAIVYVDKRGLYENSFVLKSGRAGEVVIDYDIHLQDFAGGNITTKIYAREDDKIFARESMHLEGKNSHGMLRTRMALRDRARSEVVGEMVGIGEYSRGHVECTEIVMDDSIAKASPIVMAKNPRAKVTHEAAIGSVDKKQIISLMARGLNEDEAVEAIVNGLLR